MVKPINIDIVFYDIPNHGRFGGVRKHDIHTGVDIYCGDNEQIYSIEKGIVIGIFDFTGPNVDTPWWEDTKAIMIEGESGVILYGETYEPLLKVGDEVSEGQQIGNVKRVLKKDKGLPMTMLHIELYKHGYRGDGEVWINEKPTELLNIEEILQKIYC